MAVPPRKNPAAVIVKMWLTARVPKIMDLQQARYVQWRNFSSPGDAHGAVVLIEASDRESARELFQAVSVQPKLAATVALELAPGLFFARAQPSRKYWIFNHRPAAWHDG